MNLPTWFQVGSLVGVVLFLLLDLALVSRRPHEPSMREATILVVFYITLAVAFGLVILAMSGPEYSGQFFAGWLTEYSLSVDNLFVFIIIMSRFAVPREYQQKVLLVGIILALVLRGIFILIGAAAIERFSWVFYLFGAFLLYTAVTLVRQAGHGDEDFRENRVLRCARRVLPSVPDYHGAKVSVRVDGKRLFTPMLIVMLAIGTTDLLFALDSIPAIYGLTEEPYLVFTANVFALMGLRQLYFLIGGLLKRLVYLSYGLAFLLAFIGVKLVLHALHENSLPFLNGGEPISWAPDISIAVSLLVIIGTLVVTTVLSLTVGDRRSRDRSGSTP